LTVLTPRQAYRLWAPAYRGENAVCVLEDQLVSALTPSPRGKRLLDVGCGVGLRLKNCGAAFAVGVDASPEMLAASGLANVAAADVRALPFAPAMFDLIWCRLMLGYLPDLRPGYAELARVCRKGGLTMVSDFHPEASRAGHRQTFRDAQGVLHEIAHNAHAIEVHVDAAAAAGLSLVLSHDGTVGPAIRPLYEKTGRLDMYDRDLDLPIVALFLFEKD
jgi:malonyl-CoA O-methyltransferase